MGGIIPPMPVSAVWQLLENLESRTSFRSSPRKLDAPSGGFIYPNCPCLRSGGRVDPTSALTGERIQPAVRQDIEASRSWVYAHADELGGYRVRQAPLVPMAAHARR